MKGLLDYWQDVDFMNSGKNIFEISARAVTEVNPVFSDMESIFFQRGKGRIESRN